MSLIRLVLFPFLRSLLLATLPACLGSLPDSPGEPGGPKPGQRPSPTPSSGDLLGSSGTGLGRPLGGVPGAALHSAHWEGEAAACHALSSVQRFKMPPLHRWIPVQPARWRWKLQTSPWLLTLRRST